jgi:putative tricarboxylic transport membrane protein
MMDYNGILTGFQVAIQPTNVIVCFIGVLMGTLVGILPGLGSVSTMSLLLPITYGMSPVSAIILLGGIYYGAAYGGSTTSILVNLPGETSSVMTCLDGYQMARNGRAGAALGISAFASFIAGTLGIVGLMLVAPPLAEIALKFGPPEYFSLMMLGMAILTFLSSGPMWKTLLVAAFGVFLGCIGMDSVTSTERFTFGIMQFADGISIVPICMGLFGISEVMLNVEEVDEGRAVFETKIGSLLPTLKDWITSFWPIMRGTFMGFFLGTLPGGGAVISSFISYAVEKRLSKHPDKFGTGMIEGVAGPEAANNAGAEGAFIPLLSLGIPCNAVMALLLGALIIHGIQPGPLLIKNNPEIFWGIMASMYMGNVMLLVLNLPLIGLWVRLLKVPYSILFPIILLFCMIGAYCSNNSVVDVILVAVFALIGYLFKKFKYELAPVMLAFVLGPMLEESLRQSLLMAQGSPLIFLSRPISVGLIVAAFLILIFPFIPFIKKKRVTVEESD